LISLIFKVNVSRASEEQVKKPEKDWQKWEKKISCDRGY
jgi:hypothetical protein